MSHAIIMGSTHEDIEHLEDTLDILHFVKNILSSNKELSFADSHVISSDRLDTIITWYTGIHSALTDPASFFANSTQLD